MRTFVIFSGNETGFTNALLAVDINTKTIRRLRDNLLHAAAQPAALNDGHVNSALKEATMRRIEPFAEMMYLVMMADGRSDVSELQTLVAALQILAGGRVEETDLVSLMGRFAEASEKVGVEARVAQLGGLLGADRDDREMAFTLAAVIAVADDSVEASENEILEMVGEYLGISASRAGRLLEQVD
jgi:tellurite resistance protein